MSPETTRRTRERVRAGLRALLGSRFSGPVLTLVTGSALAQGLAFAVRPALTRLYTPEEFGVLTLFLALVALADTVSSGRYEDALLLPSEDRRAANLLAVAAGLVTATGLVVLLAAGAVALSPTLGADPTAGALLFLPLAVVASGWHLIAARWHARQDRFGTVSSARVAQSVTTAGLQLAAGLAAAGAVGLVAGAVAGSAVAALVTGGALLLRDGRRVRDALSATTLRRVARRYVRFPRYAAPAALLKGLAGRVAVLALALFGTQTVGLFGLAYGSLALPLDLLTGAVGEVFFVRAAETGRGERLATLTAVTFRRLAALSLFPCLVVLVAGPALFAFVFGAEWRAAGVYAQVLAPWVLLTALSVPLTGLFDVLERQRADLVVAVALFAGQAAGLLLGGGLGGPLGAVIGVSAAGVGLRLLHLGWMLRMADAPLGRAALDLGGRLLLALPFLLPLLVAQALRAGGWVLLAAGGAGALGYYAVVGWRERG